MNLMIQQRLARTYKMINSLISYRFAGLRNVKSVKKVGPNLKQDFSQLQKIQRKQIITSGRCWRTQQLRIKSNEDLHKLWFVCVKQKNILLGDLVIHQQLGNQKQYKYRLFKVKKTMNRILGVVNEREQIKKQYRLKLENQYIQKKKIQLKSKIEKQQQPLPQITWQMLRDKYLELRKGIDNVSYLQKIWNQKQLYYTRKQRMISRLKTVKPKNFTSFWNYQMTIGQRPLQQQILRAHIKNWRSLNLKQRKIILGFLNAKRSKDAKATFIKQLKILGDKIAQDQVKSRIQNQNHTNN